MASTGRGAKRASRSGGSFGLRPACAFDGEIPLPLERIVSGQSSLSSLGSGASFARQLLAGEEDVPKGIHENDSHRRHDHQPPVRFKDVRRAGARWDKHVQSTCHSAAIVEGLDIPRGRPSPFGQVRRQIHDRRVAVDAPTVKRTPGRLRQSCWGELSRRGAAAATTASLARAASRKSPRRASRDP